MTCTGADPKWICCLCNPVAAQVCQPGGDRGVLQANLVTTANYVCLVAFSMKAKNRYLLTDSHSARRQILLFLEEESICDSMQTSTAFAPINHTNAFGPYLHKSKMKRGCKSVAFHNNSEIQNVLKESIYFIIEI